MGRAGWLYELVGRVGSGWPTLFSQRPKSQGIRQHTRGPMAVRRQKIMELSPQVPDNRQLCKSECTKRLAHVSMYCVPPNRIFVGLSALHPKDRPTKV